MATHNPIYEDPCIFLRRVSGIDENKMSILGQPIHNHKYIVTLPLSPMQLVLLEVNHLAFVDRISHVNNFDILQKIPLFHFSSLPT